MHLSVQTIRRVLAFTYIATPVLCTPFYLSSTVAEYSPWDLAQCGLDNSSNNVTAYTIVYSPLALRTGLLRFNFYFFSIACKLIPCLVVVCVNLCTVQKIKRFHVHHRLTVFSRITAKQKLRIRMYVNQHPPKKPRDKCSFSNLY